MSEQQTIKRTMRVVIEKEILIEMPAEFGTEKYLNDFRSGLWDVESVDDIFKYAAEMAAKCGSGYHHDGLGLLTNRSSEKEEHVKFTELDEEIETEFVE